MTTVSVIIPFAGDGERARNWDWIRARYAALHGWEVVEGAAEPWSKGAAVAEAVGRARGDVLVVADADSFVEVDALRRAVLLADQAPWVVPFSTVRRLTPPDTERLVAGPADATPRHLVTLDRPECRALPGGGIVVLRRDVYEAVPLDPRFVGWGGEDLAWGWALDCLAGRHRSLPGHLWHLWHPPPPPTMAGANRLLAVRYRRARRDPAAMRALVEGARDALGPSRLLS